MLGKGRWIDGKICVCQDGMYLEMGEYHAIMMKNG